MQHIKPVLETSLRGLNAQLATVVEGLAKIEDTKDKEAQLTDAKKTLEKAIKPLRSELDDINAQELLEIEQAEKEKQEALEKEAKAKEKAAKDMAAAEKKAAADAAKNVSSLAGK